MLGRHGIEASFYVPGYVAETHEQLVAGHKGGGARGGAPRLHARAARDDDAGQGRKEVLVRGTEIIERITGERPVGYRSPSWELSEHSLPLLLKYGFEYDSRPDGK